MTPVRSGAPALSGSGADRLFASAHVVHAMGRSVLVESPQTAALIPDTRDGIERAIGGQPLAA